MKKAMGLRGVPVFLCCLLMLCLLAGCSLPHIGGPETVDARGFRSRLGMDGYTVKKVPVEQLPSGIVPERTKTVQKASKDGEQFLYISYENEKSAAEGFDSIVAAYSPAVGKKDPSKSTDTMWTGASARYEAAFLVSRKGCRILAAMQDGAASTEHLEKAAAALGF